MWTMRRRITLFFRICGSSSGTCLQMNDGPVFVDQRQCMAFLTAGADPSTMREDPIIQKEWPLLKEMAEATNVVDIYDPLTWNGIDFEPVLDIVHTGK